MGDHGRFSHLKGGDSFSSWLMPQSLAMARNEVHTFEVDAGSQNSTGELFANGKIQITDIVERCCRALPHNGKDAAP